MFLEPKAHTPLQGGTIHTLSWYSYKPDDKSSMRNGRAVFTASGMYPLSFATQIFHNGQPSHDRKTFEVMTSTYQIKVITKLPNSEQSYKGKVQTHNYINRQNQSTTGKL